MHIELGLPLNAVYGFLLVLARVAGAFLFVPLPGARNIPNTARVVLVVAITAAWWAGRLAIAVAQPPLGLLVAWVFAEAAFGLTVGVAISFLTEAFLVATQVMGLQAGYGYAATIDPTTQADASVLQVIAQLAGSLLFFALGMDRHVIRIFARSLEVFPAGSYVAGIETAWEVVRLGSYMFSMGLRLALPVVALLLLVDIALALLGRIHAQMQLLILAFPIKMLAALGLLASMTLILPAFFEKAADHTVKTLETLFFG
jgi:flagellar biosynthetic protein FliR